MGIQVRRTVAWGQSNQCRNSECSWRGSWPPEENIVANTGWRGSLELWGFGLNFLSITAAFCECASGCTESTAKDPANAEHVDFIGAALSVANAATRHAGAKAPGALVDLRWQSGEGTCCDASRSPPESSHREPNYGLEGHGGERVSPRAATFTTLGWASWGCQCCEGRISRATNSRPASVTAWFCMVSGTSFTTCADAVVFACTNGVHGEGAKQWQYALAGMTSDLATQKKPIHARQ